MNPIRIEAQKLIPTDRSRGNTTEGVLEIIDYVHVRESETLKKEEPGLFAPIVVAPYEQTDKYIIIDGNQRAFAYGSRRLPISAYVVSNDEELKEVKKILKGIVKWPHPRDTFSSLYERAKRAYEYRFSDNVDVSEFTKENGEWENESPEREGPGPLKYG